MEETGAKGKREGATGVGWIGRLFPNPIGLITALHTLSEVSKHEPHTPHASHDVRIPVLVYILFVLVKIASFFSSFL